jgi:hypothetical protein
MMTNEQTVTAWSNAYNAALTGLLASNKTASNVPELCKVFADQAVKGLQEIDAKLNSKRLRQEA